MERNTIIDYITKSRRHFKNLSINGKHQSDNVNLAIKAAKKLYKTSNNTINIGVKKIFWPGRVQLVNKEPTVIFDVAHNDNSLIALCESVQSIKNEGRNFLLISIQKTKLIPNAIPILKDTFSTIIYTNLNDKMYTASEFHALLSPFDDLRYHDNAGTSIESIMKIADINDLVVVAGSHYWGEHIASNFKFFLGNNIIKL